MSEDVAWAVKYRPSKDDDTWWWVGAVEGQDTPLWANRHTFLSFDEAEDERADFLDQDIDARIVRITRRTKDRKCPRCGCFFDLHLCNACEVQVQKELIEDARRDALNEAIAICRKEYAYWNDHCEGGTQRVFEGASCGWAAAENIEAAIRAKLPNGDGTKEGA